MHFHNFFISHSRCFYYGLKGQKHIAQGKANRVSRHPGYFVSIINCALKGQKHFLSIACGGLLHPRLVVRLLPFQGAGGGCGIIPRVPLPMVACPGLGGVALSGRC